MQGNGSTSTLCFYLVGVAIVGATLILQSRYMKRKYRQASVDRKFMKAAAELALHNCSSVDTAYNVGCVITSSDNEVLTTGYSREVPGNTHAEEVALNKLAKIRQDAGVTSLDPTMTLYTTMVRDFHLKILT